MLVAVRACKEGSFAVGMSCPNCGMKTRVRYTEGVMRIRFCPACNFKGQSIETWQPSAPAVVSQCPHCKRMFKDGDTCSIGGCPMGGDV